MKRRSPGEGSVYKRADGMWASALSFVDSTGKRRRKVLYAKTRRGVLEKLRTAQQEERAGTLAVASERLTVAQFLTHWMEHTVKSNVRPTTYSTRLGWVNNHMIPAIGHHLLKSLTIEHIERFQAGEIKDGRAVSTVRNYRTTLVTALEAAVRRGYIARNVARLAGSVGVQRKEMQCFDQEEARAFITAVSTDRFHALFAIAITLGLRKGELLALRWQDVDLDRATLQVNGSLQRIDGKQVRVETKTASSNRTLRLPPLAVDALRARRTLQLEERLLIGPRWVDTGYLFTSRYGAPVHREHLSSYFHTILKRVGLRRIRFHDLRHTAATLMLASGVQVHVVSKILGHSSIVTTLDKYGHVIRAMEERTIDIISAIYA